MPFRTPLLVLLACALSGCVTVPETLQGEFVQEPLPRAVTEDQRDQSVRWGGLLYAMWSEEGETCMELVARPLDRWYRPDFGKSEAGPFLACHDGPLDPEEFFPGRDVTVVGVLETFAEAQVGEDIQLFPVVRADSIHVWPLPAQFRKLEPWGQSDTNGPNTSRNWAADRYIYRR